ncbi:acetate/propionate family kinase [bacterium]|nr:acetate/propionate family kinase [bacterium]
MKILVANPGSTSYKCKLFDSDTWNVLFQAGVERIGEAQGIVSHCFGSGETITENIPVPDYISAVNLTLDLLRRKITIKEISAIGFKTVLAKDVTGCVLLTPDVIDAMKAFEPLAPVHTQVYLNAIGVFEKLLPAVHRIGLFETSFHRDIPPEAHTYGIPHNLSEKHGIRKYGFHGASHRFVSRHVRDQYFPGRSNVRIITCHLGGSSSVCATKDGVSVDTSMGMSPQCGLLNAKRVGDLDPFALLYLMEKENLDIGQARKMLISRGGVFGISELSGDFRDIEKAMDQGDRKAGLAFRTFAYYVKRYIGEYLAVLNGADAIAFTGGLGQNSPSMRKAIVSNLENLGILLDEKRNDATRREGVISQDRSPVLLIVCPTDEERVVAEEVAECLEKKIVH